MQKYLLSVFTIIWIFLTHPLFATEGYFGENPGFDFYSKIDTWTYNIQKKLVSLRLQKAGNFSSFGRNCQGIKALGNTPVDEKVLKEISEQNYSRISALLQWKSITSDDFQALVRCLWERYDKVKSEISKEQSARETVASIWLYADGDKSNSDYDIIYDIERINQLIFSTEIKYNGTKNIAKKSLESLLAGNEPSPLLSATSSIMAPPNNLQWNTNNAPINTNNSTGNTLANLLSSTCTSSGFSGPVDTGLDDSFLSELSAVMNGSSITQSSPWYSASNNPLTTASGTSGQPAPTNANDFFHKMPCQPGSMFCIDVKTVPGGNITLWGGKNVSIEWILDAFTKHLLPISESSLAYQKMTNNAGSFPIKDLKLWKSIWWLRVYLWNQPQPSRRDKEERTPSRDEAELKAIIDCWYITAWLPTDMARANSIWGAWFAGRWDTTELKYLDIKPLWVQESISMAKLSGCMNEYMQEGRQTYYNSISTDLTEIQAFTISMLSEIRDIMTILSAMDDKPVK